MTLRRGGSREPGVLTLPGVHKRMSTSIRIVPATELESLVPSLVELLRDTVNGGVPMGFLAPLTPDRAREYWQSLRSELQSGARVLLAASTDQGLVGSGQLAFPSSANGRHRAEVQKVFVAGAVRGGGVGRALMAALHNTARQHGRTLIHLNTRRGLAAEGFYKALGYQEAGVLPGWTVGSAGERYDHVTLYQELSE